MTIFGCITTWLAWKLQEKSEIAGQFYTITCKVSPNINPLVKLTNLKISMTLTPCFKGFSFTQDHLPPNIKTKIPRASCTGQEEIFALYRSLCGITLLWSQLLQMDGLLLAAWKAPIWDSSPKIRNFWMLTLVETENPYGIFVCFLISCIGHLCQLLK